MGRLVRSYDWAATALGPVSSWPDSLRVAVEICLASPLPGFVAWGAELIQIHNDAAIPLARREPREALGKPLLEAWPAIAETLGPMAARARCGEGGLREDVGPGAAQEDVPDPWCGTLSCVPLRDAAGGIAGLLGTLVPASAGPAMAQDSRRLRSLVEGIPQLVWRAADGGHWTWSSPQWTAYTGLSEAASQELGWLSALHPEDREAAMEAWRRAEAGAGFEVEYRIHDAREGRYRWFQTRARLVRHEAGMPVEWVGTSTDVDALRRMAQQQRLLLAELQHRVRNTLAVIRSIIRRTVEASETVEDLAMHVDGRIDAFARVQAAVTRDPGAGLDLAQLIADELRAQLAREGRRVRVDGPSVQLRAKAAESLALAIHELATNAVKYGALSFPGGAVEVVWEVEERAGARTLVLVWQESGVRGMREGPRHRGFGTDVLERSLPYELNAEVRQEFRPDGLCCRIELPLSDWVLAPVSPEGEGPGHGSLTEAL
jgi:PAS domain S-box-containing protein